ncbi:Alpha-(1,3)-fucosyltransferase C [Trichinella sp. T6]|nr:Alpha-(1,3)-fucosyltransferase C [Trichinella sp. T6]
MTLVGIGFSKIALVLFTFSLAECVSEEKINILMWTHYSDANITNDFLKFCPEQKCQLTYDRRMLNNSAAVVFYDRTVDVNDLPPQRLDKQHFVFFLMETPYYKSLEAFDKLKRNFYTLTMTYRTDSDIYSPFGYFKRRKNPIEIDREQLLAVARNKTKMIGWLGSNCKAASKRYLYMDELKKHIDLDIYGKCGLDKCAKTELIYTEEDPCEQLFRRDYKFYLAMENSVCNDWVTEKIFNRINMVSIPIIFNRSIYEAHVPGDAFIAADDFDSPQKLADYLHKLASNDEKYIQYFEWRKHYETVTFPDGVNSGFCRLCQHLTDEKNNGNFHISPKAQDLQSWFVKKSECIPNFVPDLLARQK